MKSAYHPAEFAEHYPSGAFVLSMFMAGFISEADDAFEKGEVFPGPIHTGVQLININLESSACLSIFAVTMFGIWPPT